MPKLLAQLKSPTILMPLLACLGCAAVSTPGTQQPAAIQHASPAPLPISVRNSGTNHVFAGDDPPPLATYAAASRLLDQATFGPTASDIQHVQTIGIPAYLTEQFNTPTTLLADVPPYPKQPGERLVMSQEFFSNALVAPDQLRQRVAFTLSEIMVVSSLGTDALTVSHYHNMLANDAFGNFQTLLHDVAVSNAMGGYLNMLNSAAPPAGQIANENFARELMQLFTIGPNLLNADGSLQLDANGNTIPTYTGDQIQAFARAYTGWTYANQDGSVPSSFPNTTPSYQYPMVPVESAHDTGVKILLNGTVLPPGQTAGQDLDQAIANVFNHPNVGPFISRQLIQHLVMSNPSPAYVTRIAAVFNDNGQGVRGDMTAVLTAILTDHKARGGDTVADQFDGHLREPILWLVNFCRGLGFTFNSGDGTYQELATQAAELFELPYQSPSVFNFFPPDYMLPGTTITAPEFAIENTASSLLRVGVADELVNNQVGGLDIDLTATGPIGSLAGDPGALVDQLGLIFMHGQMPGDMRGAIVNHISTLSDAGQMARVATLLVITSPQYKILH